VTSHWRCPLYEEERRGAKIGRLTPDALSNMIGWPLADIIIFISV